MSRKKKPTNNANNKTNIGNNSSNHEWVKTLIVPLIPLMGVLVAAYLGYLGAKVPIEIVIAATQTAEAKPTEIRTVMEVSVEEEPPVITNINNCPPERTSKIQGDNISATITITKPSGVCPMVSENEVIELDWFVSSVDTYFLWVFVYSPSIKQYFPRACGTEPLQAEGTASCWITFSNPEFYEIVIVIANRDADSFLRKQLMLDYANLPHGIEEKASISVYRSP